MGNRNIPLDDIRYEDLPEGLQDGMRRYIEHGIRPGNFLTAVLENNLCQAFWHADLGNLPELRRIVNWCCEELPCVTWGSEKRVDEWIASQNGEKRRVTYDIPAQEKV